MFYLSAFDFTRKQAWIWFAAYAIFPIGAAWIAWRMRNNTDPGRGPALPRVLRVYLTVQGTVVTLVAAVLLFLPASAIALWPWAITPLPAQMYSAPFFSYGFGSFYAAQQSTRSEVVLFLIGTLVFALVVLRASVIHSALFSATRLSSWIWFTGFGLAALVLAVSSVLTLWQRTAAGAAAAQLRQGEVGP